MRYAFTFVELVVVLAVTGILLTMALPPLARARDRLEVRSAVTEIFSTFATARELAVMQERYATVAVDSTERTILLRVGEDTIHVRNLGERYGVDVYSNRDSMAYSPTGLGYGAADQSIVVSRGAARDTVLVSRLGRVRY